MKTRKAAIWQGIGAANGFALICMAGTKWLVELMTGSGAVWVFSEFVILPLIMGLILTFIWRSHHVSAGPCFGYGALSLLFCMLLSFLFMGEGIICVIIVAPLLYLFLMLGILMGTFMFKRSSNTLNISVLASLAAVLLVNISMAAPSNDVVMDTMVIQASPQQVWKHVVAFEPITEKPDYWLFRVGLPSPQETTVEGYYVGADRKCIFNKGIVFDETIVEYEPNKKLTFDITKQPDHPELLGHIQLLKGQFILEDNGDGTTTLIGNSWYDLKIKPALYFDLWTQSVISNVHTRVMEHIKQLAENEA